MGKIKRFTFLFALAFLLTGCNAEEAVIDVGKQLIPSWLSFVVQICAFAIMLIIVFVFAYKPIKKILQKRSDYVEENIRQAEEDKAIAKQNLQQSNEMILASKKKANEIIEEANVQAMKNSQAIISDTNKEVAQMKKNAEIDIENSKKEAKEEIQKEMIDVAMMASSEILKREVKNDDNERLAKDFIEKL